MPRSITRASRSSPPENLMPSTDVSMLEEFLRSSETQAKSLRQTPGLTEAAQRVTGPSTGFFGYNNQLESMRTSFELMKKDPGSATSSPLGAMPGLSNFQAGMKDWFDFTLLPSFDRISKYFNFTVYGGSSTVQGLTFKIFAPAPPQLRASK